MIACPVQGGGSGGEADTIRAIDARSHRCLHSFDDIPEVPFYTVDLGRRGQISYSLDDLKGAFWSVSMTLGQEV